MRLPLLAYLLGVFLRFASRVACFVVIIAGVWGLLVCAFSFLVYLVETLVFPFVFIAK